MYIITIILELKPDTNHEAVIDYYEQKIVPASLHIPGIEKINCVQLRSTPFNKFDPQPLRNLFYQVQIGFISEQAVDEVLQIPETMKLMQRFLLFSKCKFHWFVGHENSFSKENSVKQKESY